MESAPSSQDSRATEASKDNPAVSKSPKPVLWKPNSLAGKEVPPLSASPPNTNACSRGSPVRLNMAFGGVGGEKLPLLSRIVALFDNSQGLFLGFRFFYDDGTSACYGTHLSGDTTRPSPCSEMSFLVCGEQGERVTEMRALRGPIYRRDHIRGLTVWRRDPGTSSASTRKAPCADVLF